VHPACFFTVTVFVHSTRPARNEVVQGTGTVIYDL
jgi:hypothetical protein